MIECRYMEVQLMYHGKASVFTEDGSRVCATRPLQIMHVRLENNIQDMLNPGLDITVQAFHIRPLSFSPLQIACNPLTRFLHHNDPRLNSVFMCHMSLPHNFLSNM